MQEINYRTLEAGKKITVVTAWAESESFDDVANGHFFTTSIEKVYFEPRGEMGFLRIFAKDGDGYLRRVNYVLEDGQIKTADVVVRLDDLRQTPDMISLNDHKSEFVAALRRVEKSRLDVFADFEPDTFVVANFDTGNEYRIHLASLGGEVFAKCSCPDFINRRRICKHLAIVLRDTVFGELARKQSAVIY